jgi:hypothetical protein
MTTSEKNPHDICSWDDPAQCEECSIIGKLQCHEDIRYSAWFGSGFMAFAIPIVIGMFSIYTINIGLFWGTIGSWVGYLIFFFLLWEPQMLCSHCPYYAEGNTKILHCYANHGFLKTAKFKPGPMSKSEQIQFVVGILLFIIIPLPFLIIGQQYVWITIAIIGFLIWLVILQKKICPDCLNFSCPFNRVPTEIRDEFLKKNRVMREAWEKKGYNFE